MRFEPMDTRKWKGRNRKANGHEWTLSVRMKFIPMNSLERSSIHSEWTNSKFSNKEMSPPNGRILHLTLHCVTVSVYLWVCYQTNRTFLSVDFFYWKATTNLLLRLAGRNGKKIRVHRLNAFSQRIKLLILVKSFSSIFFYRRFFFH